ncbi:hypothetical protein ACNKHQ_19850 [Shigella flexneri]
MRRDLNDLAEQKTASPRWGWRRRPAR